MSDFNFHTWIQDMLKRDTLDQGLHLIAWYVRQHAAKFEDGSKQAKDWEYVANELEVTADCIPRR